MLGQKGIPVLARRFGYSRFNGTMRDQDFTVVKALSHDEKLGRERVLAPLISLICDKLQ
jgi:hypothetical protein